MTPTLVSFKATIGKTTVGMAETESGTELKIHMPTVQFLKELYHGYLTINNKKYEMPWVTERCIPVRDVLATLAGLGIKNIVISGNIDDTHGVSYVNYTGLYKDYTVTVSDRYGKYKHSYVRVSVTYKDKILHLDELQTPVTIQQLTELLKRFLNNLPEVPEYHEKIEGYNYPKFPYKETVSSYSLTSMFPETSAKTWEDDYIQKIKKIIEIGKKNNLPHEDIQKLIDSFTSKYLQYIHKMNSQRGRMASWHVVGASKYPASTMRKRAEYLHDTEDKLLNFIDNFFKKTIPKFIRTRRIEESGGEANYLTKELEELKRMQSIMKEANRIIRNKRLTQQQKIQKLKDIGAYSLRGYTCYYPEPDSLNRYGFPSYDLTSINNKIKRIESNIKKARERESMKGEEVSAEYPQFKIVKNYDKDRLMIYFPNIPPEDLRTLLKKSGFRWSPHWKAWVRKLTDNAVYDARSILFNYYHINAPKSEKVQQSTSEYIKARKIDIIKRRIQETFEVIRNMYKDYLKDPIADKACDLSNFIDAEFKKLAGELKSIGLSAEENMQIGSLPDDIIKIYNEVTKKCMAGNLVEAKAMHEGIGSNNLMKEDREFIRKLQEGEFTLESAYAHLKRIVLFHFHVPEDNIQNYNFVYHGTTYGTLDTYIKELYNMVMQGMDIYDVLDDTKLVEKDKTLEKEIQCKKEGGIYIPEYDECAYYDQKINYYVGSTTHNLYDSDGHEVNKAEVFLNYAKTIAIPDDIFTFSRLFYDREHIWNLWNEAIKEVYDTVDTVEELQPAIERKYLSMLSIRLFNRESPYIANLPQTVLKITGAIHQYKCLHSESKIKTMLANTIYHLNSTEKAILLGRFPYLLKLFAELRDSLERIHITPIIKDVYLDHLTVTIPRYGEVTITHDTNIGSIYASIVAKEHKPIHIILPEQLLRITWEITLDVSFRGTYLIGIDPAHVFLYYMKYKCDTVPLVFQIGRDVLKHIQYHKGDEIYLHNKGEVYYLHNTRTNMDTEIVVTHGKGAKNIPLKSVLKSDSVIVTPVNEDFKHISKLNTFADTLTFIKKGNEFYFTIPHHYIRVKGKLNTYKEIKSVPETESNYPFNYVLSALKAIDTQAYLFIPHDMPLVITDTNVYHFEDDIPVPEYLSFYMMLAPRIGGE